MNVFFFSPFVLFIFYPVSALCFPLCLLLRITGMSPSEMTRLQDATLLRVIEGWLCVSGKSNQMNIPSVLGNSTHLGRWSGLSE